MPSRTSLLATATAALLALSAPLAFSAPPQPRTAKAAAAARNTDRAAEAVAARPAAVTSSGTENAGTPATAAFDGNATTRWAIDFADNAWIQVDLGSVIRVSQVRLEWEAAFGKQYVLEISKNGTDWTDFYTETQGTGGTVTAHTYPQEATRRYVRMRGVEEPPPGATPSSPSRSSAASPPPLPRPAPISP